MNPGRWHFGCLVERVCARTGLHGLDLCGHEHEVRLLTIRRDGIECATLTAHGACSSVRKQVVRRPRKRLDRSEEHTSELQSQSNLVCRLLLVKKKTSFSPFFPQLLCSLSPLPIPTLSRN